MSAYYADLYAIKRLVTKENNLQITIPIKSGDYALYWDKGYIEINILDILNWAAWGFYEYIERDKVCHKRYDANNVQTLNDCINPAEYYKKVVACIEWICNKFSIPNSNLKDYSQFRPLRHFIFDNEGWMDEDEINDALKNGFKQIDLDLINEAEKGNGIACYELIKKGANYKIDPIDFTDESIIVNILGSDLSYHFLNVISYLYNVGKFNSSDCYDMLSSLYQVGVGNYILDIITMDNKE